MQMDLAPLFVSLGAGATVILVVAALSSFRGTVRVRTAGRLAALSQTGSLFTPASALRSRKVSNIPLLDTIIRGRRWVDSTRDSLAAADVQLLVGEYVALRAVAAALTAMIAFILLQRFVGGIGASLVLTAGGALVGWFIPPLLVRRRRIKRAQVIETQLVELCDVMASMLTSGYGYAQALAATAQEVGPPLGKEMQRLLDTVRLGGNVDEALEDLNKRLNSRDFDIIATAISIQRRSGGNLGEILSGTAETIRERQSFIREVAAITAKERFTAIIVAGFPLALGLLMIWMAPDPYLRLFTDFGGRIMLGAAVVIDLIGFFIIRKLSTLEV